MAVLVSVFLVLLCYTRDIVLVRGLFDLPASPLLSYYDAKWFERCLCNCMTCLGDTV